MRYLIKLVGAFVRGLYEFRSSFTAYYDDLGLREYYDVGRETAHKITFRHLEDSE